MRYSITAVAALIFTAALLFANAIPAGADGTFRWQNEYDRNYLEIWLSGKDDGNWVVTWGFNSSSKNQWWHDQKLSDGYYRVWNANSLRVLDRKDTGEKRNTGFGTACSHGWQWGWTGQRWQRWKGRRLYSSHLGRHFLSWINKEGCGGDRYHDRLSLDSKYTTVTLVKAHECDEGRYTTPTNCYWRRNGK